MIWQKIFACKCSFYWKTRRLAASDALCLVINETKMCFSPRLNIRFWIVDHAFQSNPIKGSYKDQQQIRTLIILKSKKMQIWMFCLQLNFFVCITSEPVLPRSQPDSNLLYNDNKYANGTTIWRTYLLAKEKQKQNLKSNFEVKH